MHATRLPAARVLQAALVATLILQAMPAAAELEEVIVTARKREESILQVPVVATALTQEQLTQYGTSDLFAVAERVPGLLFGSATGSFGSQVSLRGVGTATLNATIDQSVSLNIDGMQMTQGLAYQAGMFDMAQLEVLRGPQALFYGKSSTGGVISIRTAGPSDVFEMIARGGYEFDAEEKRGELIVSGPVTDTLGLRLATSYSDSEGFFENRAVAVPGLGGRNPKYRTYGGAQELFVRGTAVFEPSDRFTAQLKLNYVDTELRSGSAPQMASCPEGTASPSGVPFLGAEDCKLDDVFRLVDADPAAYGGLRNNGTPFSDDTQAFGTLELNYRPTTSLTLTSVTGHYENEQDILFNGTLGAAAGPTLVVDNGMRRRDFTEEVRLASDFAHSPLNFTVGAFYQNGYMKYLNNLRGNTTLRLPSRVNVGYHVIDIRAISGFGQLMWQVLPQLELAAGARWTQEERDHKQINTITGTPVRTPLDNDQLDSDNVSPEATVTYTPDDDLTLFASYKQAYKSGSFDSVTIKPAGSDLSFADEAVRGYEGGVKTRLFDRALTLNLAGYSYHYRDLQVGTNEISESGAIAIRTVNAATANIYGVDFDATYQPPALANLTLNAGLNYNHARYGSFDNAPCYGGQTIAMGCNRILNPVTGRFTAQDLSGRELMRAPEWSANFGIDYEMSVAGDLTLALGASTLYSDDYYTNLLLRSDMIQDSYFKTSAHLSLRGARNAWEVALIGNNLENEITTGNCINSNLANGVVFGGQLDGGVVGGPAGVDELACNVEPGRAVWIRLTVSL